MSAIKVLRIILAVVALIVFVGDGCHHRHVDVLYTFDERVRTHAYPSFVRAAKAPCIPSIFECTCGLHSDEFVFSASAVFSAMSPRLRE